jgi:nucleotide-binding universal stress UspA family protein
MRYIVATDGSKASLKAAQFLAQHPCPGREDEVFVVYVFPLPSDPEFYAGVVSLPTDASDERVTQVARPILAEAKRLLAGLDSRVEDVVLVGDPAREIIVFATTMRVDLVVAGTHGRSLAKELCLGSVSSALTHLAPCSVLIVR